MNDDLGTLHANIHAFPMQAYILAINIHANTHATAIHANIHAIANANDVALAFWLPVTSAN